MRTDDRPGAQGESSVGVEAQYPAPKTSIHPDAERSWVRRMLPVVWSHKGSLIAAWLATFASVLLALAMPWFVREGVNGLVLHREDTVRTVVLALVAIALARFACGFVYRYWMLRSAYSIEYDLRSILYEHFTRLSFSFYDRVQSGQLMSRANSDIRSVEMFLAFAPTVAIQLVTFVIALVLMIRVNAWLTLIALLPMPGVWYFGMKMRRQMFPVSWLVQQRMADVATIVDENVTGVRVVKSFAAEVQQIRQLASSARRVQWASVKRVDLRARFSPTLQNLPVLGSAGVLFYGGYLVANGRLDVGATAIIIAHRLSTAMRAQRLGVVEDGQIVELGSHEELVALDGRYAQMYETWMSHTQPVG